MLWLPHLKDEDSTEKVPEEHRDALTAMKNSIPVCSVIQLCKATKTLASTVSRGDGLSLMERRCGQMCYNHKRDDEEARGRPSMSGEWAASKDASDDDRRDFTSATEAPH